MFKLSNIYFLLALVILGGSIVYGVTQMKILNSEKQAIADNAVRRVELAGLLEKQQAQYKTLAELRVSKDEAFLAAIGEVLPPDENYIELTKTFDDFFAENDKPASPIFNDSLRYGKGEPVKGRNGVSVLPVSLNLEATRDNFFRFLDFVNQSGLLETGRRLMEINSIQLTFPEDGDVVQDMKQKLQFSVEMNAYYRTPKQAR